MRIATFNVQNMRLRRVAGAARLDGARDDDLAADRAAGADAADAVDRRLTAAVLRGIDADVVALQEVFDGETLDYFHDRYLLPAGAAPYPHRICLPGNDGRGLDVALMSRIAPDRVESHAALTAADLGLEGVPGAGPGLPLFRRDCLLAEIRGVSLYVCHFKASYPDEWLAREVRRLEALAVRRLIERRFADPAAGLWLVLGDLNESRSPPPGRAPAIAALTDAFAIDLLDRTPAGESWSYMDPVTGQYSRPDAMLASPALAARWPGARPVFVHAGLGREAARFRGARLPGVGRHRPHASDHAALVVDLDGL